MAPTAAIDQALASVASARIDAVMELAVQRLTHQQQVSRPQVQRIAIGPLAAPVAGRSITELLWEAMTVLGELSAAEVLAMLIVAILVIAIVVLLLDGQMPDIGWARPPVTVPFPSSDSPAPPTTLPVEEPATPPGGTAVRPRTSPGTRSTTPGPQSAPGRRPSPSPAPVGEGDAPNASRPVATIRPATQDPAEAERGPQTTGPTLVPPRPEPTDCRPSSRFDLSAAIARVAGAHDSQLQENFDRYVASRSPGSVSVRSFASKLRTDTMAAEIAVVSNDGCLLASAPGYRHVYQTDHAEEKIVPSPLRELLTASSSVMPGRRAAARMVVVVNSPPCAGHVPGHNCYDRLENFAGSERLIWLPNIPSNNDFLWMPNKPNSRTGPYANRAADLVRQWLAARQLEPSE